MPDQPSKNVLSWASDIEGETIAQAARSASMPFVEGHVALMPDAHFGLGATVGSVIPTKGAIMPAAVGVDIGCGMIAVETNIHESELPDDLSPLLSRIEEVVPAGVGKGHKRSYHRLAGDLYYDRNPNASVKELNLGNKATEQFGTLGSGNHFVEICLPTNGEGADEDDRRVWVVLHSGSRGVGNQLARGHINKAKKLMEEMFISLEDPALAYFVQNTPDFDAYMTDLMWAQDYALANRDTMMDAVLKELAAAAGIQLFEKRRINCHHNYTVMEHHRGQNLYITRKGAIRAAEGDFGVIPGSMGTNSFIVEGRGNPASYNSSAHGAGRRMSRSRAKQEFDAEDLAILMEGKTWLADRAASLVDEIPESYKDIHQVMRDQADLVTIKVELEQILNYKGT